VNSLNDLNGLLTINRHFSNGCARTVTRSINNMTNKEKTFRRDSRKRSQQHESDTDAETSLKRRHFVGISGGIGVTLLAGCATRSDTDSGGTGDGTDDTDGGTDDGTDGEDTQESGTDDGADDTDDANVGTFRLLISDQPTAIDDFDSLDVSFDQARIFRGDSEDEEEEEEEEEEDEEAENEENGTDGENNDENSEEESEDEEESEENSEEESEDEDDEDDEDQRGFSTIDLDGENVDLTEVVGEKAIGVFEGELEKGRYSKIELHVAEVDGIVDGDSVEVKVPSEKLQIVKPFEVRADEELSFVFDINVVKKGQTGEYNLLPVISKSGVSGEDVEVEEIDDEDDNENDDGEGDDDDGDDEGDDDDGDGDTDENGGDEKNGKNGENGEDNQSD